MKKLFGDSVVSKLRTVPAFCWVFFVFATFFFAHAYEYLVLGEYSASLYAKLAEQYSFTVNTAFFGIFTSLLSAGMQTLIFEVVVFIVYGLVAGRYRCNINKKDFAFRIRYFMVLVNLLIGILSIGFFFTQRINGVAAPHMTFFGEIVNYIDAENPYYLIQNSFLPFLLTATLAVFFFEDFRKRFVPLKNQTPLFINFALIYVGVSIILFAIDLIRTFVAFRGEAELTLMGKIAYGVEGGSYLLVVVGYVLYYLHLKKITKNDDTHDDDNITFVVDNATPDDGNIYDDFGF